MAIMATNHVTVAMDQVATTSLPRYSHFFISNYIIPSHYDQMLFFSVHNLLYFYYNYSINIYYKHIFIIIRRMYNVLSLCL